jgi:hypothetical protein
MLACTTYDLWGWNSYIEMTENSSIWELDFLKKSVIEKCIFRIFNQNSVFGSCKVRTQIEAK